MEENYKKLLGRLGNKEPEATLESRIISRVHIAERSMAHRKAWAFSLGSTAALVLTISSGIYLYNAFLQSGFYQYLTLAFSGFSGDLAVYSYWKELSVSLFDTLPIVGTILFLGAVGFLVWSGTNAIANTRRVLLEA